MIASISILCFNKSDVTKKCLDSLSTVIPEEGIETLITNNGSSDDTENVVLLANLPNKVYIPYGENLGFIRGHNEALKIARGTYFIALNNDLIFKDKDWMYKLLKPLEDDPNIKLVGLTKSPSILHANGNGGFGKNLEYIDGACIAGRTEDFINYGLFSEDLKMFYFEDSDISLRYRQMGFSIHTVEIDHVHQRSTTANSISQIKRMEVLEENRVVFQKKWGTYLRNRMFTNNILVKMNSHGGGDIICMTPILEALRREHPRANIELETNWPEIFYNNPYVSSVHVMRKKYNISYDRQINLNLNYASYKSIIDESAIQTGIYVENKIPQLFLTNEEINLGINTVNELKTETGSQTVVACALQMERSKWQGRNWPQEHAAGLIRLLQDNGIVVIELGKGFESTGEAALDLVDGTNIRELFSIISAVDGFVGIDSMPFHIAQAFKIPSFIIFGATEPISRVVDFTHTYIIRNEGLPCLHCYQKKGISTYNHCLLGREACMEDILPETILSYVIEETDPSASNIRYLQNMVRAFV